MEELRSSTSKTFIMRSRNHENYWKSQVHGESILLFLIYKSACKTLQSLMHQRPMFSRPPPHISVCLVHTIRSRVRYRVGNPIRRRRIPNILRIVHVCLVTYTPTLFTQPEASVVAEYHLRRRQSPKLLCRPRPWYVTNESFPQ